MKITGVQLYLTDDNRPSVFVKIETDEGISGYGESSIGFMPRGALRLCGAFLCNIRFAIRDSGLGSRFGNKAD